MPGKDLHEQLRDAEDEWLEEPTSGDDDEDMAPEHDDDEDK